MGIVKSKLLKQISKNYPNFLKKDLDKFTDIILKEIKNTLKAHIEDGVAVTKFLYWFKKNEKELNEKKIEKKLDNFRKKSKNTSFGWYCFE